MVPRFERILKRDDDTLLPAVSTLPVISEDEEDEISEEEGEEQEQLKSPISKAPGDEEETETSEHSSTSPLLNKFPGRANFPNGDIIGGLRLARNLRDSRIGRLFRSSSFGGRASEQPKDNPVQPPPPRRGGTVGGGVVGGGGGGRGGGVGGGSPAYLRTLSTAISSGGRSQLPGRDKIRPCRTASILSGVSLGSSQKSEEAVLVHSLQMEVEGTRTSVDKLERRLDSLCSDVKDIGSTLQQILKAMGNKPLAPPPKQTSKQKSSESPPSQTEAPQTSSASAEKQPPLTPVNQVKTYMKDAPQRRLLDRQRSAPVLHQGVSPMLRQAGAGGRPQFFFGNSPEKECFSDLFSTACAEGTCGVLRGEFSPSLGRGYLGGVRPSPTLSPLSQGSVNSHTHLIASEDDKGSPRLSGIVEGDDCVGRGRGGEKSQYFNKVAGSDSEHDLLSANGHSSSCSPPTPLSPYSHPRPEPYPHSPSTRFKMSGFRRRGTAPTHHELHRQVSMCIPDPPHLLDRSSGSEESLTKSESLPLEPLDVPSSSPSAIAAHLEEIRAPLSRAESFSDLLQPQDSTEL
ncbi:hypothetical protein V1264_012270 [Littorina saxatilis]|uniref:Uncharacterized protein n=1 Tax=Littorina saxatilis TaxID=31220 RepID=A0AAN9GLA3_9CAEN